MVNKIKKYVLPGEVIGVEEEFLPSHGTYIDEMGYIRSQLIGRTLYDIVKKTISVKHVKGKPVIPRQGDIVEGTVSSVSEDLAFIDIYAVNDKYFRTYSYIGIIHVSQASQQYIASLYDAFRPGEVVKARVLNNSHPYQLTTRDPGLGVIIAYCSKCGSPLYKKNDRLICPRCGSIEKRKISSLYILRK